MDSPLPPNHSPPDIGFLFVKRNATSIQQRVNSTMASSSESTAVTATSPTLPSNAAPIICVQAFKVAVRIKKPFQKPAGRRPVKHSNTQMFTMPRILPAPKVSAHSVAPSTTSIKTTDRTLPSNVILQPRMLQTYSNSPSIVISSPPTFVISSSRVPQIPFAQNVQKRSNDASTSSLSFTNRTPLEKLETSLPSSSSTPFGSDSMSRGRKREAVPEVPTICKKRRRNRTAQIPPRTHVKFTDNHIATLKRFAESSEEMTSEQLSHFLKVFNEGREADKQISEEKIIGKIRELRVSLIKENEKMPESEESMDVKLKKYKTFFEYELNYIKATIFCFGEENQIPLCDREEMLKAMNMYRPEDGKLDKKQLRDKIDYIKRQLTTQNSYAPCGAISETETRKEELEGSKSGEAMPSDSIDEEDQTMGDDEECKNQDKTQPRKTLLPNFLSFVPNRLLLLNSQNSSSILKSTSDSGQGTSEQIMEKIDDDVPIVEDLGAPLDLELAEEESDIRSAEISPLLPYSSQSGIIEDRSRSTSIFLPDVEHESHIVLENDADIAQKTLQDPSLEELEESVQYSIQGPADELMGMDIQAPPQEETTEFIEGTAQEFIGEPCQSSTTSHVHEHHKVQNEYEDPIELGEPIFSKLKEKLEQLLPSINDYSLSTLLNHRSWFRAATQPTALLTKLHDFFVIIDAHKLTEFKEALLDSGICCGECRRYKKNIKKCDGGEDCFINLGENFHLLRNETNGKELNYCTDHFGGLCSVGGFKGKPSKLKADIIDEKLFKCTECNELFHQSCKDAGLLRERNCSACQQSAPLSSPEDLKETACSRFVQEKIRKNSVDVIVREIASFKQLEQFDEDSEISKLYKKHGRKFSAPFNHKMIAVFFKRNGNFICVMVLCFKEFGAGSSKSDHVVLDYLDSVQYIDNRQIRNSVYTNVLIAYWEYMGMIGYSQAQFWACTPEAETDYLISQHPIDQKYCSKKTLFGFYDATLKRYDVAHEWEVVDKEDVFSFIERIYSTNGFWPSLIEKCVSKLEQFLQKYPGDTMNPKLTEEFKKLLLARTRSMDPEELYYFKLHNAVEDTAIAKADEPIDSKIAESKSSFLMAQYKYCEGFGTESHAVNSTSKLVELLLKEQEDLKTAAGSSS